MNVAIILAGGSGTRVGAGCPKQFIEVLGRPILAYTLDTFQNCSEIDYIVVVCHTDYIEYLNQLVDKNSYTKVKCVAKGGSDFQKSVINGLKQLEGFLQEEDLVMIHYGAAPFTTNDIIEDALRVCKEKGNAVSGTPCYQLMGTYEEDGSSREWLDRDKMIQIASPQCFKYKVIRDLYHEASACNMLEKTEPHTTSLMYALNKPIYISKGSQSNIKITTKEDVEFFIEYAKSRN